MNSGFRFVLDGFDIKDANVDTIFANSNIYKAG